MTAHRRRLKQTQTPKQRLTDQARHLREEARQMGPGCERDALLRKARQIETASHIDEWLSSPELKPPT